MSFKLRSTFVLVLIITFLIFPGCNTSDTITLARPISDAENGALVSSAGSFKLGFFGRRNSPNRYVGIWFNKVPKQTVVWVANRDAPLKNGTGVFKIADDGNVAVFHDGSGKTPLWSSNVSAGISGSATPTARLLDSGNLVLAVTNGPGQTETVLWQSFHYLTDTMLPGVKVGFDRRTGATQFLTSWKSEDDPTSGEFKVCLALSGSPQIMLYKGSERRWRVGPWNGQNLNGVPAIISRLKNFDMDFSEENSLFNYSFVDNHDGIFVSFGNSSTVSRVVLESQGTISRQVWRADSASWLPLWVAPRAPCEEYSSCGPSAICNANDAMLCSCLPGFRPQHPMHWHPQCVSKRPEFLGAPPCGDHKSKEGFWKMENVKIPDVTRARVDANKSLEECRVTCLKDCDCTAYASADISEGGNGCIAWYGELNDMIQYTNGIDGQDFYLRVDAMELEVNAVTNSKGHLGTKKILSIIISSAGFVVLLLIFSCYFSRKCYQTKGSRRNQFNRGISFLGSDHDLDLAGTIHKEETRSMDLTFFGLDLILIATNNFSSEKMLGRGGFGAVYKGQLSYGKEIAVKRLSKNSGQGTAEFKNEVEVIAKLQHRNLVQLLGCCIENEEKILVYEYMPNKSLNYFIFDETRKSMLNWKKRLEIILGIARGILYLHQDSRLRIIHRDLKASNVLLDADLNPKISDFGTARIFLGNQSQATTNKVIGTYGYMSPEYALDGLFSTKSDVFSFGVLLLEIIIGKKHGGFFQSDISSNLITYAWDQWSEDRGMELVDSSMANSCPSEEVLRCIQVGLLCVQDNPTDRPTMSNVVFMLSNETTLLHPKKSVLVGRRYSEVLNLTTNTTTVMIPSVNEVTLTMVDGR